MEKDIGQAIFCFATFPPVEASSSLNNIQPCLNLLSGEREYAVFPEAEFNTPRSSSRQALPSSGRHEAILVRGRYILTVVSATVSISYSFH